MTALNMFWGFVLGACLGSFLTCAAWRLPQRTSLGGRSICPACRSPLRARWNVPVAGWVALRGRAGCCDARIPARYVLIEAAVAVIWAALAAGAGVLMALAAMLAVVVAVVVVSKVTERHPPPA